MIELIILLVLILGPIIMILCYRENKETPEEFAQRIRGVFRETGASEELIEHAAKEAKKLKREEGK